MPTLRVAVVVTEEPPRRREARTSSARRAEKPIPWGRERGQQGRPLSQREDLEDHITETSWGACGREEPSNHSWFHNHAPTTRCSSLPSDPPLPALGEFGDLSRPHESARDDALPGGAGVKEGEKRLEDIQVYAIAKS
jgi:hypothetical protein